MTDSFSEEVWRAAMRLHGHEIGACHELTEDASGAPLGVHRRAVTGFVIDASEMRAIADEINERNEQR